MNCTRVLLPGSSGLSADMAMRLCFASSPPIHSFLSSYDNLSSARCKALQNASNGCKPLRPCLSSKQDVSGTSSSTGGAVTNSSSAASSTSTTRAAVWSSSSSPSSSQNKKKKKKQQQQKKSVVWSDSRGLALTTVHLFREFTDHLHFHLSDLEGAAGALRLSDPQAPEALHPLHHRPSLLLAFPQPAADYLDFRNRLQAQRVSLENCAVQEGSLRGTVKVRNIAFQKNVFLRVSFNGWSSSEDVACSFLNNVYGCKETDTFSFCLELSQACQQVEFCVCYEAGEQTFWDNNNGNNYRLMLPSDCEPDGTGSTAPVEIRREGGASESRTEMAFDPFGSPRTSAGIFPEWQSWGRIENSTPYW